MIKVPVSRKVNYANFGFIPRGNFIADLKGKLLGYPNLFKRLQARDIMDALDIRGAETALDFGCGSGYMTIEMAKAARKAYGIDITPEIERIIIPDELSGKLEFIRASGVKLPFPDGTFDVVLASEVLPMIPDPVEFLTEIRRVLKSGGRLVLSNGAGHPAIREAFENRPWYFRVLESFYAGRMPESYEQYCSILQGSFGTAQKKYFDQKDIAELLAKSGFHPGLFSCSPGNFAGSYLSWSQFLLFLRTGKTLSQHGFVCKYHVLSGIQRNEKRKYPGGLLCVARTGDKADA